jgi:hypothetical protein
LPGPCAIWTNDFHLVPSKRERMNKEPCMQCNTKVEASRLHTCRRTRRVISTSPITFTAASPIITALPPSCTLLVHWENVNALPSASIATSTPLPSVISCEQQGIHIWVGSIYSWKVQCAQPTWRKRKTF